MAEIVRHAPMRLPVTITTGVWALATGAVAEGTGTQTDSLTLAVVAGSFILAAAIVTPIITALISRTRKPSIDHRNELLNEQAEFIDHLRAELVEARSELADAHERIRVAERRRRG